MGKSDVTHTVTYTKNAPVNYTPTIYYKYADGGTAASTYTKTMEKGSSYSVSSPSVSGYTADKSTVSGTLNSNTTVTVTYTKNPATKYTIKEGTYKQISMDEAVKLMESEQNYIILDVRRPDEFAAGHIPHAINVPNETIGESEIAELPDKKQLIFVYCRSGRRSKEASEKLVKLGYTNIMEFGGILDWKGEIER